MSDRNVEVRYLEEQEDKEFTIESMRKYVHEKQEMDKFLETLITPLIENKRLSILDACCGIGHIIYFLKQISPDSEFTGIDKAPYLIEEAKKLCAGLNVRFEVMDLYRLGKTYGKRFDISISWKTLSWLERYEKALEELFKVTKRQIFVSSLFYDEDIDFQIKVREYGKEASNHGFTAYYNVYSLPRFEKFCFELGAKKVTPYNFELKIDIPQQSKSTMGTYTERLEDGRRIQISGAVLMLWKIIRIDLQ